jgi:hypothetical protein
LPDSTLSEAIKEAYATVPVGRVIYHTLEIWHDVLTDPIYIVQGWAAIDARIEAGATRNAGDLVTFIAMAFDVIPPDQESASLPECTITIDNVSQELIGPLDAATTTQTPVAVIYRAYLDDALDDGPENDPPAEMQLKSVNITPTRITATAGFPNLLAMLFPKTTYDAEAFPGLGG